MVKLAGEVLYINSIDTGHLPKIPGAPLIKTLSVCFYVDGIEVEIRVNGGYAEELAAALLKAAGADFRKNLTEFEI